MSVLANFLATYQQAIIERYTSQLQQLVAPAGLTYREVANHMPDLLGELERSLRHDDDDPPSSRMMRHSRIAQNHGRQRLRVGFDLNGVVLEYGLLRDCIYEQLQRANLQPPMHELRILAAGLSGGVADSVTQYVGSQNEQLEAERMHLLAFFEQAPGLVAFLRGPDHVFALANEAFEQLVGHRAIVGQSVRQSLPELEGQGFFERLDRVVATGEPYLGRAVHVRLQREPGGPLSEAFVDFLYQPIRDRSGQTIGILVQGQDVTEARRQEALRQEAEAALRSSEERYRTLFETIDDGFCVIEVLFDAHAHPVDYRYLQVNAAFEHQTGLTDVVGKTMRELVPGHESRWFELYGQAALTGEPVRFEQQARGLGERWYDVYASRVEPAGQRHLAVLFKDISDRKHAELQRDQLIGELSRSNAALDQFAYVVSHDLKAPLRGIANLSQWIEEDIGESASEETRRNLVLTRGRVQQLESLINGILTYSTAGRRRGEPEKVDVGALVTEVIGLLDPPDRVTIDVDPSMPTLVTERVPLQQVLLNLIGNAVKHTQRPDARVQVESRDEGPQMHLTVTDNGPGIAPKDQERIWGVFQKLARHGEVEGTGIGLSVVKRIVESRGGTTWVESSEGQGATFHVRWPLRSASVRP